MRRLPHRLRLRRPLWVSAGGPALLTAAWVGLLLFAVYDRSLHPFQLRLVGGLLGVFSLLCILGLSRVLAGAFFGPSITAEASLQPARRGEALRCFVVQHGTGSLDVRLQCLRAVRGGEETLVDLPVGRGEPAGLRVQVEADVLLPADAPPSAPFQIRWRLRTATIRPGFAEIVREFRLTVV